jgi:hypothetical protein
MPGMTQIREPIRADGREGTAPESRCGRRLAALFASLLAVACAGCSLPAAAAADGPLTPIATSYEARISHVPQGLQAKVVDGYLSLWLQAPADANVTVLDYYGAPWLHFDRSGVFENRNSREYYLSQTPLPETPPSNLTPTTHPRWVMVSSSHSYTWREGRLHSVAQEAVRAGISYVGPWSIRMRVDGRRAALSGGVWHAGAPSIVWFWPIVVLALCALAAWRLHDTRLNGRLARSLAFLLLALLAVAALGRQLHGRPTVGAVQVAELAVALGLIGAAGRWLVANRTTRAPLFAIAFVSLWVGLVFSPVLLHGFVLLALPPVLARASAAVLLGGSVALALLA